MTNTLHTLLQFNDVVLLHILDRVVSAIYLGFCELHSSKGSGPECSDDLEVGKLHSARLFWRIRHHTNGEIRFFLFGFFQTFFAQLYKTQVCPNVYRLLGLLSGLNVSTSRILEANISEFMVSSTACIAGFICRIISVLESPTRHSCNTVVRVELR
jgi:hypothetical protein